MAGGWLKPGTQPAGTANPAPAPHVGAWKILFGKSEISRSRRVTACHFASNHPFIFLSIEIFGVFLGGGFVPNPPLGIPRQERGVHRAGSRQRAGRGLRGETALRNPLTETGRGGTRRGGPDPAPHPPRSRWAWWDPRWKPAPRASPRLPPGNGPAELREFLNFLTDFSHFPPPALCRAGGRRTGKALGCSTPLSQQ